MQYKLERAADEIDLDPQKQPLKKVFNKIYLKRRSIYDKLRDKTNMLVGHMPSVLEYFDISTRTEYNFEEFFVCSESKFENE